MGRVTIALMTRHEKKPKSPTHSIIAYNGLPRARASSVKRRDVFEVSLGALVI
jgi:hypothetical protein